MIRRRVRFRCLAALALCIAGCSDPPLDRSSDVGQLDVLVGDLSDATRTQATFQALFATGATPADAQRAAYSKFTYRLSGEPTIEGEEATLRVAVRDNNDTEIAVADWKASKSSGAWKLADAPLPP